MEKAAFRGADAGGTVAIDRAAPELALVIDELFLDAIAPFVASEGQLRVGDGQTGGERDYFFPRRSASS